MHSDYSVCIGYRIVWICLTKKKKKKKDSVDMNVFDLFKNLENFGSNWFGIILGLVLLIN